MRHNYWDEETSKAFREMYSDPYGGIYFEPFDDVEPALQFGWNHALADEYPNESWEEVEEDLERAWRESHRHVGEWEKLKEHVRYAWERAREDWQGLASKKRKRAQ
ncbi:MAG: hypothetical protein J7M34_13435 [Anaerolineae bacterium]|nr:hypothetical protein [Anaerolineae bacterium]